MRTNVRAVSLRLFQRVGAVHGLGANLPIGTSGQERADTAPDSLMVVYN